MPPWNRHTMNYKKEIGSGIQEAYVSTCLLNLDGNLTISGSPKISITLHVIEFIPPCLSI